MLLSNEKYAKENVYWTLDFVLSANYYIYQCAAKQVEIAAKDKDVNKVVRLLSEYIHYVYVCGYKDICVIPFKHLDYIVGDYLTYKIFTDALRAAERDFSLKIHTGTLDEENWESEYICIQKKDRKN
jgi:hypothetical protein